MRLTGLVALLLLATGSMQARGQVVIYRCTKDGMVFEGRNPPSKGWYPGVNPRNID